MTYKLLIVDDSKLARMAATKALKALYPDWTRVEAANADEALSLAKQTAFDIALLDFNMPGRDGLQLAADLLALRPSMPLAVISANHQDEIVARAKRYRRGLSAEAADRTGPGRVPAGCRAASRTEPA